MPLDCKNISNNPSIRRFGDCALVEIIHLHDCLRGAISALQEDVTELTQEFVSYENFTSTTSPSTSSSCSSSSSNRNRLEDLERRVAGRFQVIWSVFKAHSAAEDEFIWPALKQKIEGNNKPSIIDNDQIVIDHQDDSTRTSLINQVSNTARSTITSNVVPSNPEEVPEEHSRVRAESVGDVSTSTACIIEQEEYEEDHASEERMFMEMDVLLSKLRKGLNLIHRAKSSSVSSTTSSENDLSCHLNTKLKKNPSHQNQHLQQQQHQGPNQEEVQQISQTLKDQTFILSRHLLEHLEKEENHCIPLVKQHMTHDEINDLVGRIMGQRSSDVMVQILNLAVNNLPEEDREDMVRYMKQAMVGTFFERWLTMGGWIVDKQQEMEKKKKADMEQKHETKNPTKQYFGSTSNDCISNQTSKSTDPQQKKPLAQASQMDDENDETKSTCSFCAQTEQFLANGSNFLPSTPPLSSYTITTSQEELNKLIRVIASNPELTPIQKNTTIQGLRDSVWKSRRKRKLNENNSDKNLDCQRNKKRPINNGSQESCPVVLRNNTCQSLSTRIQRTTPPSGYYRKNEDGVTELVWSSTSPMSFISSKSTPVPLFSSSELAPTHHDGAAGGVLGCPHYARSCKLRHPSSGRLYTCRLCCEQEREMPMKDKDAPLDRYSVTEILCMRCNTIQPSGNTHCINAKCESGNKPFAKYHCKICNFYDDTPHKSIYHCPFCNVCRSGKGLGIDYRHCMRCNACVSLTEDNHVCIPQRLQGNCPICHETMFESTEPLRGLQCGHVMHLSCFSMYIRGQAYTCPLCKKSVEDMKDYFALLDSAVRMQPMPAAYAATHSQIYCQDCGQVGKVRYHFVGCKCNHCGSYNTREIQRSEDAASPEN